MKKRNKADSRGSAETDNIGNQAPGTIRSPVERLQGAGHREDLYDHILKLVDMLPHSLYVIDPKTGRVKIARSDVMLNENPDRNACYRLVYNEERRCSEAGQACIVEQVLKTGRFAVVNHCHRRADGQERHYEVYGYPLLDSSGEINCVIECPQEVTGRRTAQREAEQTLLKYRNIFEAATDGIVVVDFDDSIIDANPGMCRMFGYSFDEITRMHGRDLVSHEYQQVFKQIRNEIETRGTFSTGIVGKRKDGSTFFLDVKGTAYIDVEKRKMLGILRDISKRKKAEQELIESRARYRNLFNAATEGLMVIEKGDRIVDVNPQLCKMFGYSYDELLQMGGRDLAPPEELDNFRNIQKEVSATGRFRIVTKGLRRDGSIFDMEVMGSVFSSVDRKQMLGIFRDISEQIKYEGFLRHREKALLEQSGKLEEANSALKVLLERREHDRREIEETLMINFKELVQPYVDELKSARLSPKQTGCLNVLENNLRNIVSPFLENLKSKFHDLTPAEIRVANLIREGKRTKEIADIMGLSKRTIDFYRYNIRKKLALDEKSSLATYLSNLS